MTDEKLLTLMQSVDPLTRRVPEGIRFIAQAIEAAERERWIAKSGIAYTEAHAIFNDPPSETPQVVRDVIEWHLHAMRANEQT